MKESVYPVLFLWMYYVADTCAIKNWVYGACHQNFSQIGVDVCGSFCEKFFKMYDITSSDCEMIQLYEYIIVDKMACAIFDYIF